MSERQYSYHVIQKGLVHNQSVGFDHTYRYNPSKLWKMDVKSILLKISRSLSQIILYGPAENRTPDLLHVKEASYHSTTDPR